jgi:hypothetical protein
MFIGRFKLADAVALTRSGWSQTKKEIVVTQIWI